MKRSSGLSAPHSGDSFFFFPSFIPLVLLYGALTSRRNLRAKFKVREDTLFNSAYCCPVWGIQTLCVRNRRFQREELKIFPKKTSVGSSEREAFQCNIYET